MANKTGPGIVKMKCMLWEPKPIVERVLQDQAFVYNKDTFQTFPATITRDLNVFQGEPSGIYLREKYIYRDTFLRIGDETLNSERENMVNLVGDPLFDGNGLPLQPYVFHQTFSLVGSLFGNNVVTPTGIRQGNVEALDNGLSKWTYEWADCSFNDGGNAPEEREDGEDPATAYRDYKWRQVRRLMPLQVAVSAEQKTGQSGVSGTSGASGSTKPKPIHWLCLKDEPLYQGEDFWVEFRRRSYAHDIVGSEDKMLEQYQYLDIRTPITQFGCGQGLPSANLPINGGVIDVDADGAIAEKSKTLFDLHVQPYYIIEIGHKDKDHNYFILLSYNANPVFIHAGQFPVIVPGDEATAPFICPSPEVKLSRRLGVYDISCKELMDQNNLRITVRNHFGRIVVTFSGYEDKPWVIERNDYSNKSNDQSQNDFNAVFKPMIVPNAPVQIGAGNMKVGFLFGPLHYEVTSSFTVPQAVCVRGPLELSDINLLLREKIGFKKNGKTIYRYFQDAEVYFEMESGAETFKQRIATLSTDEQKTMRAKGKNSFPTNTTDVANAKGNWISYIAIQKISPLTSSEDNSDPDPNQTVPPTQYVKYFNAQYTLRAGDFSFEEHDDASRQDRARMAALELHHPHRDRLAALRSAQRGHPQPGPHRRVAPRHELLRQLQLHRQYPR
jgi:hypothetical protein